MRKDDVIALLESLRLPEKLGEDHNDIVSENNTITTSCQDHFMNDPAMHSLHEAYPIYDSNNETIITRTAKSINEGKLIPYNVNWMEVTLYDSQFERQLLELIDSSFIMDVAQAIDDEDMRHTREDGYYTIVTSYYYGTGQLNRFSYSYKRENWNNDQFSITAESIAKEILDNREKVKTYAEKLKLIEHGKDNQNIIEIPEETSQFDSYNQLVLTIESLSNENEQLRIEKGNLEKQLEVIKETNLQSFDIMIVKDKKIDVIKILHAMCQIGLFQKNNGSKVNTKDVMINFGKLLNSNFSEYSSNLSTSKSKTKESSYLQVFSDLATKAKEYFKNT